jgi:hypothetical protein
MGLFPDPLEMPGKPSSRKLVGRLYHGETRYDFVGRAKLWFAISGTIILIGLVALIGRGLNLGIDFEGGVVWEMPIGDTSVDEVRDELLDAGFADAKVQSLESDEGVRIRVQNVCRTSRSGSSRSRRSPTSWPRSPACRRRRSTSTRSGRRGATR